jgi:hypothetical protein
MPSQALHTGVPMPGMQTNPYNMGSMPYANQSMYKVPEINQGTAPPMPYQQSVFPPQNTIKYQGTNLPNPSYIPRPNPQANPAIQRPQPRPGVPFVNPPMTSSPFDIKTMQSNPNIQAAGMNMPPRMGTNPSPTSESKADSDMKRKKMSGMANEPDNKKMRKDMPTTMPSVMPIQRPIQYIPRPAAPGSGQVTYQMSTQSYPTQPGLETVDLVSPDVVEQEHATTAVQRSEADKEAELAKLLLRDSLITKEANSSRSTRSSNAHTVANQDDGNILSYDDVGRQVVNVLANAGVTIEERAVYLLMQAIQSHTRRVLEIAISYNKKRLNKNNIGHFSELSKAREAVRGIESQLATGSISPDEANERIDELLTNQIGMKWGPDTRRALGLEDLKKNEHLRRVLGLLEESLVSEIREYNTKQSIQLGNKRIETSHAPKWVHDEYLEKQGDLSWEEIITSRVRGDAAKKHNMTLPANKRPYQASTADANRPTRNFPEFVAVVNEAELTRNERCPLITEGIDLTSDIKIDDVAAAISKLAQSKAGGPFNQALGSSLRRYHAEL